jgi:hypothetical protein
MRVCNFTFRPEFSDIQHFFGEWSEPDPNLDRHLVALMRHRDLMAAWDKEHPKEAAKGKPWPRKLWHQAYAETYTNPVPLFT